MKISDIEKIDSRFMFKIYDKWPQISKESYENSLLYVSKKTKTFR